MLHLWVSDSVVVGGKGWDAFLKVHHYMEAEVRKRRKQRRKESWENVCEPGSHCEKISAPQSSPPEYPEFTQTSH